MSKKNKITEECPLIFYIDNFSKENKERAKWLYKFLKKLDVPFMLSCDNPVFQIFQRDFPCMSMLSAMGNLNSIAVTFASCKNLFDFIKDCAQKYKILLIDDVANCNQTDIFNECVVIDYLEDFDFDFFSQEFKKIVEKMVDKPKK